MNKKSDETPEEQSRRETAQNTVPNHSHSRQPRYLLVAWILLLLFGAFFLFASLSDLVADANTGLPSDHLEAFRTFTGTAWASAKLSSPGITRYITLLETTYAVHELVFGLLFLVIVAIPFRRGERWAWSACWAVLIADVAYTLTFGRYDAIIFRQSLIAAIALPVLLLAQLPRFFGT